MNEVLANTGGRSVVERYRQHAAFYDSAGPGLHAAESSRFRKRRLIIPSKDVSTGYWERWEGNYVILFFILTSA